MCIWYLFSVTHSHTHAQRIITSKSFSINTAQPSGNPTWLHRERHMAGFLLTLLGQVFRCDLWISLRQQFTYILWGPVNQPNEALKSNSIILQDRRICGSLTTVAKILLWGTYGNLAQLHGGCQKNCVSTLSSVPASSLCLSPCSHLHLCKVNGKHYQVRMRTIYHSFLQPQQRGWSRHWIYQVQKRLKIQTNAFVQFFYKGN